MSAKRAHGRFYTLGNPFALRPFARWAARAGLPAGRVLEPFAGANHIIDSLRAVGLCGRFASYDIAPAAGAVEKRDTVRSFPQGFHVCVTNPPWLARNSATRRGLGFPSSAYDDMYKHCLALCLAHCEYVAALLPASYLQSGLLQQRLDTYILLHDVMFGDTENPVCLALFGGRCSERVDIYHDNTYIGELEQLKKSLPRPKADKRVVFNDHQGALGFVSFDNTRQPSIRFCRAEEVAGYSIKVSSRFITRISGEFGNIDKLVRRLNDIIDKFRADTRDVFLTPFKGMRQDGNYRRRMEFAMARKFINAV